MVHCCPLKSLWRLFFFFDSEEKKKREGEDEEKKKERTYHSSQKMESQTKRAFWLVLLFWSIQLKISVYFFLFLSSSIREGMMRRDERER